MRPVRLILLSSASNAEGRGQRGGEGLDECIVLIRANNVLSLQQPNNPLLLEHVLNNEVMNGRRDRFAEVDSIREEFISNRPGSTS